MQIGLSVGVNRRGVAGGVRPPDFYVDSVGGSDSNDGLTDLTAFQTLGKAETEATAIGNGAAFALKRGSVWREDFTSSLNSLRITNYGTGNLPQINGADVVTGWTPEGTANVWQATVTHNGFGNDRFRVWEDGQLLTRVANIATCSSTPGSYVDNRASADPTPAVIYMHPTGSGNPTSNGKSYEISVRRWALSLTGSNCYIEGVVGRKCMGNNGAFEIASGTAKQGAGFDGTKHNTFWSSGTIEDHLAYLADNTTSYEPSSTFFVAYDVSATGKSVAMKRCGAWGGTGTTPFGGGSSLVMHDSSSNYYASFQGEQLWNFGNVSNSFSPSALSATVTGLYNNDNPGGASGWYSETAVLRYGQIRHSTADRTSFFGSFRGSSSATAARTFLIENTVIYTVNSTNEIFRIGAILDGTSLTLRNCTIYVDTGFRALWNIVSGPWATGSITIENCIFVVRGFTDVVVAPAGITYTGNNNIFCVSNQATATGFMFWKLGASTYNNLADWKTASGQDANSITMTSTDLATLFSGTVSNGDFRLNSTGAGATAAALNAGAQARWDWNARAAASGAPQAWPVVPVSVAEAITYTNDPTAWTF